MYRYIINRVLLVFPTLFGAATLVFVLMRLIPGDVCLVRLGGGGESFTTAALGGTIELPGIDDAGEVQTWRAPERATIPSDGRPYRVRLEIGRAHV